MNNAAIIIFKRSSLPKLLKFFAVPQIIQSLEAGDAEDKIIIHVIHCPVLEGSQFNRKLGRSLESLCLEKNINFFVGQNIGYYLEGGLANIEYRIERGNVEEIRAIKDLGALIKLSEEKRVNLLKTSMCFIGESLSYEYISTMSEEAAVVTIYEYDKMDNALKKNIFERLMSEKGISAIFTKDLEKAVLQSEIVLADNSVELQTIPDSLAGKILIGENSVSGNFEKISKVLLWYESMDKMSESNVIISFNNELLSIMRRFYKEKSAVNFIRRFPYISFSRD